jgi:hypothetical protein
MSGVRLVSLNFDLTRKVYKDLMSVLDHDLALFSLKESWDTFSVYICVPLIAEMSTASLLTHPTTSIDRVEVVVFGQ